MCCGDPAVKWAERALRLGEQRPSGQAWVFVLERGRHKEAIWKLDWILVQDFWQPSTPGKQQSLNQMCASSCGKAACCFHPSAHFPFRSIRFHVSAPAALVILPALFGYWRRLFFFFDSHLGAVPYLPKFWVYSDASNVILFSSYNGGQGPVVLGIVKMPCKRLYIIQMCFRQGKQKKE